jgi:hypothetical protein
MLIKNVNNNNNKKILSYNSLKKKLLIIQYSTPTKVHQNKYIYIISF